MARRNIRPGNATDAADCLLFQLRSQVIHRRRWRALVICAGMAVMTAAAMFITPPLATVGAVLGFLIFGWAGCTKHTFGRDGILVVSSLRRRERFTAFRDVDRVERLDGWRGYPAGITLHLRNGAAVQLRLNRIGETYLRDDENGIAAVYEVNEMKGVDGPLVLVARTLVAEAHASDDSRLAFLARSGEERIDEWLRRLRAVTDGYGSFRAPSISRAQLWEALESAGTDPCVRAAATVMLGPPDDEEERERLKAAAATTIAPGVAALFLSMTKEESQNDVTRGLAQVSVGYRSPIRSGAVEPREP